MHGCQSQSQQQQLIILIWKAIWKIHHNEKYTPIACSTVPYETISNKVLIDFISLFTAFLVLDLLD